MWNSLEGKRLMCTGPACLLVIVLAASCGREDEGPNARGAGLRSAALEPGARGDAYAVALRGAFDLGPGLVLLLDPRILPRSRTAESDDRVTPEVLQAMRTSGAIQGTCQADTTAANAAPICPAENAGYVVRVSDVFAMQGDTVQLYVTAERYRPSRDTTGFQPPLRLEQRYVLTRQGGRWIVASKERLVD
jgi:hypothetical protein